MTMDHEAGGELSDEATVTVPARLRGDGHGLPRRFRAGQLQLRVDALVWHARRGRLGVGLDRQLVRLREIRPTGLTDRRWPGPGTEAVGADTGGRIVVLDYADAVIELAVRGAEVPVVRLALGDSSTRSTAA